MVAELRINVASVVRELDVALKVLTEARIMSRYRRIIKGKGLEFEDFREYTPEDDASSIDWKASKRANKTLIRRYKEERDMNIFFAVDVSSSMLFGSTARLKYEYAAGLVAAISHFVLQSGDKVGLLLFTDKVVKYMEPGKGTDHFYVMLKYLLTPDFYGGGYNVTTPLEFLMNSVEEKSVLFMISDFIGIESDWEKSVKTVSGKFDGIALMVRDPRDSTLPKGTGQVVISDPYSEKELLVDSNDRDRMEYERRVRAEEERMEKGFKRCNWDLLKVSTEESFTMPVIKFLKRRELLLR
jgi:uncharacterized protein (DUF58 family)